jgi:hypothetical protein
LRESVGWLVGYVGVSAGVGALVGVVWFWIIKLPGYRLGQDFYARIDEWDEAQVFAADFWLAALGLVACLLGWLAWTWFRNLGWPAAALAALGGLGSALLAERVGRWLGPSDFDERLANAQPGVDTVIPIDLQSHTPVYLAVWVALAVLPVLIAAAVAPMDSLDPGWHRLETPPPDGDKGPAEPERPARRSSEGRVLPGWPLRH